MSLHLIKLCVGAERVEDLEESVSRRVGQRLRNGQSEHYTHVTRMTPRRIDELLEGGSMYWIIKGGVQCRQRLADLETYTDAEGIGRCRILLQPELVRTHWQPRRPFQGWRYLRADDVPADAGSSHVAGEMPVDLRRELAELGLL